MTETTGKTAFTHGEDTFETWYKVVGDLKSGVRPLVTLHGGPGFSHHYMLPHATLNASQNIPIIFYDQIGIGQSSHVRGKPNEFWTFDLFMDQLDGLLDHLGVRDNFDLLGHSWGGMFAGHYASIRCPPGLHHLIIASASASMGLWVQGTTKLLRLLPQDVQDVLKKHEADGTTDSQEYQDAMQVFYYKHVCSLNPWPELLLKSFSAVEEDGTVYHTMWGSNEFNITGTLRNWSIVDKVQNITSPTLLINAPNDEAQDEAMMPFFLGIRQVKWAQFAHSTHLSMYEERERYFDVVSEFLKMV